MITMNLNGVAVVIECQRAIGVCGIMPIGDATAVTVFSFAVVDGESGKATKCVLTTKSSRK